LNDQSPYNGFNSDDIRRYLSGQMSREEMHLLEKAALDDPFLADAIEGFEKLADTNIKADLNELKQRLAEKTETTKDRGFGWWRIAALFILVLGASTAAWYLSRPVAENEMIAKTEELRPDKTAEQSSKDSPTTTTPLSLQISKDTTVTSNRSFSMKEKVPEEVLKVADEDAKVVSRETKSGEKETKPADQEPALAKQESNKDTVSSITLAVPPASAPEKKPAAALAKKSVSQIPENQTPTREEASAESGNVNMNAKGAPTYYYKGRILDENNRPVPYASIRYENNKGSYADVQGNFRIVYSDSILITEIVAVGYASKKVVLTTKNNTADIKLQHSLSALGEVVVSSGKGKKEADDEEAEKDSSDENSSLPFAEPSDGWSLYEIYIKNNLRMPRVTQTITYKGVVTVSFLVNAETGKLSDFRIEKSLDNVYDKEAIRVIKDGPVWDVYNSPTNIRTSYTIIF